MQHGELVQYPFVLVQIIKLHFLVKVDPSHFYDACVKDSCACDSGGDHDCLCAAIAVYAQACNEAGVCVAWRTPKICRESLLIFLI